MPVRPADFNGIHRYAATGYHLLWTGIGRVDAQVLCLTNIHGPRMALDIPAKVSSEIFCGGRCSPSPSKSSRWPTVARPPYTWMMPWRRSYWGLACDPPSRVWNPGGLEALLVARIARIISSATGGRP
jgi:hypothetical protein